MNHLAEARRSARLPGRAALAVLAACLISTALSVPAALADGPGVGTPWVVSVGDSYISGEAGRWAGNTNESSNKTDALGSTAYYDNASNTGEIDQPLPPLQGGRDHHRRRHQRQEPRLLRREDGDHDGR